MQGRTKAEQGKHIENSRNADRGRSEALRAIQPPQVIKRSTTDAEPQERGKFEAREAKTIRGQGADDIEAVRPSRTDRPPRTTTHPPRRATATEGRPSERMPTEREPPRHDRQTAARAGDPDRAPPKASPSALSALSAIRDPKTYHDPTKGEEQCFTQ